MHIRDRNTQSNYSLLNNNIESVDQEKDLGIVISKHLKFTKHDIKIEKRHQNTKRNNKVSLE